MATKKYYGVDHQGPERVQRVASLPAFASTDIGRKLYAEDVDLHYAGGEAEFFSLEALKFLAIFPEAVTADGKLEITDNGDGTLSIDADQKFVMRGIFPVFTSKFADAAGGRKFTVAGDNTYHLRYVRDISATGDNLGAAFYTVKSIAAGSFYLILTTDSDYNPDELNANNEAFDTKLDDMLIAKVVSSSGAVDSITAYVNKHRLIHSEEQEWSGTTNAEGVATHSFSCSLDWARTPSVGASMGFSAANVTPAADIAYGTTSATRATITHSATYDVNASTAGLSVTLYSNILAVA